MRREKKAAISAAIKAGRYILRHRKKIKTIDYKGKTNLVTDIDRASESIIVGLLHKEFPEYSVLAEEGHNKRSGDNFKWIVDPLDGTTNYAHGFPFYSVSIALEGASGEIVLGVVYDPLHDELFAAEKGKGATLNSRTIRVSACKELKKSLLATGFVYDCDRLKQRNVDYFERFLTVSRAIRRAGSAALDLCYVACGRLDGFWEMDLKPWDISAGYLIVKEAGGKITDFGGLPFSQYKREILASCGGIHGKM
jgi:myo-inositol-1(or 4)-monophosphatase